MKAKKELLHFLYFSLFEVNAKILEAKQPRALSAETADVETAKHEATLEAAEDQKKFIESTIELTLKALQ